MMNIREALDEHSCSFSERYQQEALDAKKGAGRQNIPVLWVYKSVYKKKEDCTYAKRDEKGVSDSLSQ